jgi:hypothetical protein
VNSTTFTTHQAGWLRNLFATQGSVMAEPFFDKEKDFGMEFYAGEDGSIRYLDSRFSIRQTAPIREISWLQKIKSVK